MSARSAKRAKRALNERRQSYDALRSPGGYKRPGSTNPRKSRGGTAKAKRR